MVIVLYVSFSISIFYSILLQRLVSLSDDSPIAVTAFLHYSAIISKFTTFIR